jgi:transposase
MMAGRMSEALSAIVAGRKMAECAALFRWGGRPRGIKCQSSAVNNSNWRPSVTEIKRIAIDTSKFVFTLYAVDTADRPVLRKNLRRRELLPFFEKLPPLEVVLEACGGSHHWGRSLAALGHRVRLIPAQYVKPFVKRSKNDRNDAEAISVAASQPSIGSVPVKSVEQQAAAMLLSVRELLVRQRTQLVNALRGHAAELGFVAKLGEKGLAELRGELAAADEAAVPAAAKQALALLGREVDRIELQLAGVDGALMQEHKANALSRRLATIPGIGPVSALSFALRADPAQFESARHFAAWLGLVPRENSTAGKQRLGGISRAGDERLRQLLVLGATTVIQHAKPGRPGSSEWLLKLLSRKPRKLAAVALANKMARVLWAMMTSGEAYRPRQAAA